MDHATPFEAFVDALVDSGCEMATVLRHMEGFRARGRSAPDIPEPRDVLHGLLQEVLRPAFAAFDEADLLAATRALTLASDTVCDELMLVPAAPACHQPPRRRPRRH